MVNFKHSWKLFFSLLLTQFIFILLFMPSLLWANQCIPFDQYDKKLSVQQTPIDHSKSNGLSQAQRKNQPSALLLVAESAAEVCPQGGVASMGALEPQADQGLGNPIDVRTGYKYQFELDLPESLTFKGLSFARHYRSDQLQLSTLGVGWSSIYDTRLYRKSNGLIIEQADGLRHVFSLSKDNVWHAVSKGTQGSYHNRKVGYLNVSSRDIVWRWPNGDRLTFNEMGYLVSIERVALQTIIQIKRYPAHKPVTYSDALSRFIPNIYDVKLAGLIRQIDLIDQHADKTIDHLSFDYEALLGKPPRLASIDTRAGRFTFKHDYIHLGWRLLSVQRPDDMVRHYHYDPLHQQGFISSLTGVSISASSSQAPQRQSSWRYASRNGQAVALMPHATRWPAPHFKRRQLSTQYDAWGNTLSRLLPEGGALHYYWHQQRLVGLDWIDITGKKHEVINAHAAGIRHGNGLVTALNSEPASLKLLVYQPATKLAMYRHHMRMNRLNQVSFEMVQLPLFEQHERYTYDGLGRTTHQYSLHRNVGEENKKQSVKQTHWGWQANGLAAWKYDAQDFKTPKMRLSQSDQTTHYQNWLLRYNPTGQVVGATQTDCEQCWVRWGRRPDGSLAWRQTPTQKVLFEYDQHQRVAEYQSTPNGPKIMRRYVFANEVLVAVIDYEHTVETQSFKLSGQLFFVHTDPLGLPRLVTDAQQQVRWQALYSPQGNLLEQSGDVPLPHRYPGQTADPDLGWHDNYQRIYDPNWGHYLQADPLGLNQITTPFGYAGQQPRRYVDPLGLMLFAFDGTGNDRDSLTNVWRFTKGYLDGPVYYLPGPGRAIGTQKEEDASDVALAWSAGQRVSIQWERLLQALAQQNERMSAIDVVGFSRGAALARHFVNKVAQHVKEGRFWYQHPVLGNISACVDLRFLGLFDTVAQFHLLGLMDHKYDLKIPNAWRHVSHAVALHEYRWAFPLTAAVGSQVKEKAFIGAHADIGGGYLTPTASPGSTPGDLSEVALRWMFGQAKMAGIEIYDDNLSKTPEFLSQTPILHDERHHYWGAVAGNDRRVGERLQGQIAHMGSKLRAEVEAFIKRPLPGSSVANDVAGWVEMAPYINWLKQHAL